MRRFLIHLFACFDLFPLCCSDGPSNLSAPLSRRKSSLAEVGRCLLYFFITFSEDELDVAWAGHVRVNLKIGSRISFTCMV